LDVGSSTSKRVNSQTATVWKSGLLQTGNSNVANEIARSGSGDELRMGVHYVESLGEDDREVNHSASDAPHQNNRSNSKNVARAIVRIGEKFRFRVPVPPASPTLLRTRVLEVKLVSGEPLPEFMHVDMGEIAKGVVEVFGVPASPDLGEVGVGVYTSDGICVSQMILEVVKWR
jgi:axial budding pattern protein 2